MRLLRRILEFLGHVATIQWVLQWKWAGVALSAIVGLVLAFWAWLMRLPGPLVVYMLISGFGLTFGILLLLVLAIDHIKLGRRDAWLLLERNQKFISLDMGPVEVPWQQQIELVLSLYNPSRPPIQDVQYRIWSSDGLSLISASPELGPNPNDPTILHGRIHGPIQWKDNFQAGRIRFIVPRVARTYTMRYVISLAERGALSRHFQLNIVP